MIEMEVTQLNNIERTELNQYEAIIERGLKTFYEVGQALTEIREKKLYRAGYPNFEVYCLDRWNFSGERARLFMRSSEVMSNLEESPTIVGVLPANEAQARPLTRLEPEQQREAWQAVVDAVGQGKITAAHVEATVKRIQNVNQGLLSFPVEYRESVEKLCGDNDEKVGILQRLYKSQGSSETNGTFDEIMTTGGFHYGDEMDEWLNYKQATVEETRKALDSIMKYHASFNYKRDTKSSRIADEYVPQGYDACQTPAYALDPLAPYIQSQSIIWEPAHGEGLLTAALKQTGLTVVHSDILTQQNFFEYEPDAYSCIVTNPPYSLKFKWLERCYQLGKPFALLLNYKILVFTPTKLRSEIEYLKTVFPTRATSRKQNDGYNTHGVVIPLDFAEKNLAEKIIDLEAE